MLVYQIIGGHPVGDWPTDAAQRVYLALDESGRPAYAGQTRGTLRGRLAGHRSTGMSRDWAWLVFVTMPNVSAQELDAVETSARRFFLFGPSLVGRRHPKERARV